jgi:hypothetical protein
MTTPQVKIVNAETGEETLRDMNTEELAQLAKEIADREAIEAIEAKAAADKAAAGAKLAALGLTADDLKALGL